MVKLILAGYRTIGVITKVRLNCIIAFKCTLSYNSLFLLDPLHTHLAFFSWILWTGVPMLATFCLEKLFLLGLVM